MTFPSRAVVCIRDCIYIFPRGARRQSKRDKLFSFSFMLSRFFFYSHKFAWLRLPLVARNQTSLLLLPLAVSPSRHQGRHGRRGRERARDSKKGIIRERTGSQLWRQGRWWRAFNLIADEESERRREREGLLSSRCRGGEREIGAFMPSLAREVDSVCLSAQRDEDSYDNDQETLRDYLPRVGGTCLD